MIFLKYLRTLKTFNFNFFKDILRNIAFFTETIQKFNQTSTSSTSSYQQRQTRLFTLYYFCLYCYEF